MMALFKRGARCFGVPISNGLASGVTLPLFLILASRKAVQDEYYCQWLWEGQN